MRRDVRGGAVRASRSPTSCSKRPSPACPTRRPSPTSSSCPGTGEGKPPPLLGILRKAGYAPLVLLTVAAIVPSTFGAGVNLIGNNLEKSFHLSDAGLGAVAFVASVSQFLWAVPLALWADRGIRKMVAAVALLIFCVFGTLMGLSPNVWWFVLPLPVGFVGGERQPDRPQLLSGRRLSHRGAQPGVQLALPGRSHRPDGGHPDLRVHRDVHPRLAMGSGGGGRRRSHRPGPVQLARAGQGRQRVEPHPEGVGHGRAFPATERPPGPLGVGGDAPAADPLSLLRAGGRGRPRLRRNQCRSLRQPLLRAGVASEHGAPQLHQLHHRAGRLPRPAAGLHAR